MSRPDDPPSLLTPLTAIVLAVRATAALGLAVPASRVLGAAAQRLMVSDRHFRGYEAQPGDVIVSTFPKAGTNWMLQIAQQIAWRGAAEFDHIHDVAPWPDAPTNRLRPLSAPWPRSPSGHRIIKTHLPAEHTPWASEARCIAVIRDPKEVAVSAYHFVLGLLGIQHRVDASQWLEVFLGRGLPFGTWAGHAAGWYALRDRDDVLVAEFGAMKRDLPGQIDRVAAFLGVELEVDERDAVLQRSGFAWMKAHERQFSPMGLPGAGSAERPVMMRRGASGGSDELFTPEQQARIDAQCRQDLLDLGSDLPYDAWFGG